MQLKITKDMLSCRNRSWSEGTQTVRSMGPGILWLVFMVLAILLNLDKVKRTIEITTSLCNVEFVI